MNANDIQVAGTHYRSQYQHWDLVADLGLGYFEGQITKYVSRARKKNGLQDLQKARHFLHKLVELVTQRGWTAKGSATGGYSGLTLAGERVSPLMLCERFGNANGLNTMEREIITLVATWGPSWVRLEQARMHLDKLIEDMTVTATDGSAPTAGYVNQDR